MKKVRREKIRDEKVRREEMQVREKARRLVTSAFVLCGRRGAWRHLLSFCVAGVAGQWASSGGGLGRRWSPVTPCLYCVAGVALGDICLRFVWQVWRLATSAFVLCGRRGTQGTGLALVAALVGAGPV
eukprot:s864_g16.t1